MYEGVVVFLNRGHFDLSQTPAPVVVSVVVNLIALLEEELGQLFEAYTEAFQIPGVDLADDRGQVAFNRPLGPAEGVEFRALYVALD